ncbi:MAG: M20/M25/M40 family metallo-hydrolase [Microgenomates group bacterium]
MKSELIDLFIELVKIASPSGGEDNIKHIIQEKLHQSCWQTEIDSGGNLLAFKKIRPSIWLTAHLDTVQQVGEMVTPIIEGQIIKSDGTTILGADNKVGVAILVYMATNTLVLDNCGLIFTANEEAGVMSSAKADIGKYCPKLILNIDGSEPVGTVNNAGMGQIVFELDIYGKAAHAAKHPEDGVNAIEIAAKVISLIKQGKDENNNTCNVGKIEGGGATNVVSDYVKIIGEMRSIDNQSLKLNFEKLDSLVNRVCADSHSTYKLTYLEHSGVPVWMAKNDSKLLKILRLAAIDCGVEFRAETMYASSDANYLCQYAPVFSICHGGAKAHTKDEWIGVEEILMAKKYVESNVLRFNKLLKY